MADPIWDEDSQSYNLAVKTHPKDRIDVEIGDSQDATVFHPQMKMMRWDNEANVSFRLVHDWINGSVKFSEADGVITWKKGPTNKEWIARFYEDWGTEDGAYKFIELVMPKKPPTNQISFTVVSKDVDFFYQPPLTQEEIDVGADRPEHIVGSYAIYSKSSGGMNDSAGKEYKAGKVGHLYRAKLIDANGYESWAEYNIDLNETGILTITAEQAWLDNASYPVTLDPTFGYMGEGGSEVGADNYAFLSMDAPDSSGDVSSISAYVRTTAGTANIKGVIWLVADKTIITNGVDGTTTATTTLGWRTMTYSTQPAVVGSTEYYVGDIQTGVVTKNKYDIGSSGDGGWEGNNYASPENLGTIIQDTWKMSIYATYEVSAVTLTVQDGQHTQSGDSPHLSQNQFLVVADGQHTQSGDSPHLSQDQFLVVADGQHTQSGDSPHLSQDQFLVVVDGEHTHSGDSPHLSQNQFLVVADGEHTHLADNIVLVYAGIVTLVVQDGEHTHSADSPHLSQLHILTVADGQHTHSGDSPHLSQIHILVVADGEHTQTGDSPHLSQDQFLVVADGEHTQTADSPHLSQLHLLVIADGSHTQTADSPHLSQDQFLVVADGEHSHLADNVILAGLVYTLIVQDGEHQHLADGVIIDMQDIVLVRPRSWWPFWSQ